MTDYKTKSYGRNDEVDALYAMFEAGRNISMHGPRRLGKTFVLDRLIDAGPTKNWMVIKADIGECLDASSVFRALCKNIGGRRSGGKKFGTWLAQRMSQVASTSMDHAGPWYQPFLALDHTTYFERLLEALNSDSERHWIILVDELPIFLKALHDKGDDGVHAARNFMNLFSRVCASYERVRWLVTGSIGIEPLARAGQYMGALAKLNPFQLKPLDHHQAKQFVCDQAIGGFLLHRKKITDVEADALIEAVGWRAAYYLDALAKELKGDPVDEVAAAKRLVEAAIDSLLVNSNASTFGTWEEHLVKHYRDSERAIPSAALRTLSGHPATMSIDAVLTTVQRPDLPRHVLKAILIRLDDEGYITCEDWDNEGAQIGFRNPLLKRWWRKYPPGANG